MKLGTEKILKRGSLQAWGSEIERVWLTKWMPTGEYQVLGLCVEYAADGTRTRATGWCTLFGGTLKECRAYARNLA